MMTREQAIEWLAGRPVVVSVSGGKDSAALSLHLREWNIEHTRVFADTGWEAAETYDYLRGELTRVIGPIHEVRGPRPFAELAVYKGMFPSRLRRFCTEQLKVKPIAAYLNALPDEPVNAVGIRAAESRARAQMPEIEEQRGFDCEVWRPLLDWSLADVIAIHKRHGLAPNPLYLKGASRVGCWPCIFARKAEIKQVAELTPERIDEIRALEQRVGDEAEARWAAKGGDAGDGFHRPTMFHRGAAGDAFMAIDAVVEWSRTSRGGRQFELFAGGADGCMRWGLCEGSGEDEKAA